MNKKELLLATVVERLKEKGLDDDRHHERLKKEIKEIEVQEEFEYFWELHERKEKFARNQHNLLVPYLLGLVDDFDIDREAEYAWGDMPDIDIDYLPIVRDYLKGDWAPNTFGEDCVCSIGNYTTYGIKSALIDMTRVHGGDRTEILELTTKLDNKDEEGKPMTWEKALAGNPKLADFCERNPEIAKASQKLIDRNRGRGKHAGGLIISRSPLNDVVPLVIDKDGMPVSAWTEGLHSQDLAPVGYVKYDLLVITNLMQIAKATKIIKERHGLTSICAQEGMPDWSDTSYLNDPKAIALANEGRLKCVFQFDSPGIREMIRRGGVTSFDDLVAYSALYRPGPLGMKMDVHYTDRKNGKEEYAIHPLLQPILGVTYGVLVYQEQVMKVLNVVGNIPLIHCEKVRKAISKKKEKIFLKYKEMFVENGQKNLRWTQKEVENLWDQIAAFAEYGFNKSMTAGTLIPCVTDGLQVSKCIEDFVPGDIVLSINENGELVQTKVVQLHDHGEIEGYEVTFDDGYKVICSAKHKFLTEKGQLSLREICRTSSYILCDQDYRSKYAEATKRGMDNSVRSVLPSKRELSLSHDELRIVSRNSDAGKIGEIQACGSVRTEMPDKEAIMRSPSTMRPLQTTSVEKGGRCIQIPLRRGVSNVAGERVPLEDVSGLRIDQKNEHSEPDGEIKHGQSMSGSKENLFRYCEENVCKTGNTGSESREFTEMERKSSRRVPEDNRTSSESEQKVKNGRLAQGSTGLGVRENPLWGTTETSRFCAGKNLDRSGRVLSFLRTSEQYRRESVPVAQGTTARSDVERGNDQTRRCDAASIEHGMLCEFDRGDETANLGLGASHAPITNTGHLVRREIVRVVPVGKRHMFDLEVACPTHNFLLPNGVVTSNSHSVAYTYISSRLLWLKAHYPLEFFAAILSCESSGDKIKEYRIDAQKCGVEICSVDVNKSGASFEIVDGKIYIGFSNVKGIGEEPGKRIVSGQPYTNFEDFLHRFGTDASVLKPLLAIRAFKDDEPAVLWEFAEYYRDETKRRIDRDKRSLKSQKKIVEKLIELLPEGRKLSEEEVEKILVTIEGLLPDRREGCKHKFDEESQAFCSGCGRKLLNDKNHEAFHLLDEFETEDDKSLTTLVLAYAKNVKSLRKKQGEDKPILLKDFIPTGKIDAKLKDDFTYPEQGELKYYGFGWIHMLEESPDFEEGRTFEYFKDKVEKQGIAAGSVQVHVVEPPKTVLSRKGNIYYTVRVEDVEWHQETLKVWKEDFERFAPEFQYWENDIRKGNLLEIRVEAPQNGFSSYALDSWSKAARARFCPAKKEDDYRVKVLRRPKHDTLDELRSL